MEKLTVNQIHYIVKKAVKNGTLQKKPCKVCSSQKSEAHHPDYKYPLKVIWLCHKHHRFWHVKNGYSPHPRVLKLEKYLKEKRDQMIISLKKDGYLLRDIRKIFNIK